MRSNEVINKREVDGCEVHLIDQNGLIFGIDYIVYKILNVYKIDGNELIKINKISNKQSKRKF